MNPHTSQIAELCGRHKVSNMYAFGSILTEESKGVWHGLQNTSQEMIEMRFAYTPSGFEGYFREVGTPVGQPVVKRTMEERRVIAKKWGMTYK